MEFVETRTSKRVKRAVKLAAQSKSVVFLTGASHIGKTTALLESAKADDVYYCRLLPCLTPLGVVRCIARSIGLAVPKDYLLAVDMVAKEVQESVLLLDECHQISVHNRSSRGSLLANAESIRAIYDAYENCGLVLVSTQHGLEKMEHERRGALEQLYRRSIHRVGLGDAPSTPDVKAIVEAEGLTLPPRKEIVEVSGDDGNPIRTRPWEILDELRRFEGLRAITERIQFGKLVAKNEEKDLDWECVMKAHLAIPNNIN